MTLRRLVSFLLGRDGHTRWVRYVGLLTPAIFLAGLLLKCSKEIVPPNLSAPSPPVPGIQQITELDAAGPSCVPQVAASAAAWAKSHDSVAEVRDSSEDSIDIWIHPQVESHAVGEIGAFERECMLFNETYRDNALMKTRLRDYLLSIQLVPEKVDLGKLRTLGFTSPDIGHLREHLTRFMREDSIASPIYSGIRYFRVTYSVRPNAELTVNTGTADGYELMPQQIALVDNLREVVSGAGHCL
jgi:hypothetical protein